MKQSKSVFLEIFGDTPLIRVLDFLIVHEEFDYSMKDIAKFSGVGYSTLKLFWNRLEKNRIVKQTRKVGKAKMFQLDLTNPIMGDFKSFYWIITRQKVHEAIQDQKKNAMLDTYSRPLSAIKI